MYCQLSEHSKYKCMQMKRLNTQDPDLSMFFRKTKQNTKCLILQTINHQVYLKTTNDVSF
jgi:hypothetical protein